MVGRNGIVLANILSFPSCLVNSGNLSLYFEVGGCLAGIGAKLEQTGP